MSSKPVTRYLCSECGDHHQDAYDAIRCCDPWTVTMHQCNHCGAINEDKEKADACCYDDCPICGTTMPEHKAQPDLQACPTCDWQTGDLVPATQAELEAAGQMRIDV